MPNTFHAFEFLGRRELPEASLVVLFGDELFLKGRVLGQFTGQLQATDSDINLIKLPGNEATWREVSDELHTVSLFGGAQPRIVVVQQADSFVSEHRSRLEDLAEDPPSQGMLILDVGTFPANTRLYKRVAESGLAIDCRPPMSGKSVDTQAIAKWAAAWGKQRHQLKIKPVVVEHMMDLGGTDLGIIDQNLAKLALYFDSQTEVTEQAIDEYIGGWQTRTIWQVIDNAVAGRTGAALEQLDRLLHNGEDPIGLFAQISWSLRRYAMAFDEAQRYQRLGRRMDVDDVMYQAGFRFPGDKKKAIEQLKKIGRQRGLEYYRLLLECDLSLKGSHSPQPRRRIALEKLILALVDAR